ncbi:MAG TPA: type I secretion protein TolC, partial [Chromatiales bacterium]|nr:type I secretion protein TolC [Chromatiales bacterium]
EQAGALFSELTGSTTDDSRVGLQLNLPLYEGNLIVSQTREASYLFAKCRELYNRELRSTELNTRTSFLNVQANISSVIAFKQALKSARTALKATEAGYEVGTRTAVDVLNSRREVFRAERDYARSRYTYLLETLKLRKAAGILTEQDVVAINQLTTTSKPIP